MFKQTCYVLLTKFAGGNEIYIYYLTNWPLNAEGIKSSVCQVQMKTAFSELVQ